MGVMKQVIEYLNFLIVSQNLGRKNMLDKIMSL